MNLHRPRFADMRPESGPAALRRRLLLALLASALTMMLAGQAAAAGAPACERIVVTAPPDLPPFSSLEQGVLRGAAIEIVTLALNRLKLPHEIRHTGTLPQILQAAGEGKVDMVAAAPAIPDHAPALALSASAIFSSPVAVFAFASRPIDFKGAESLTGLRGTTLHSDQFGGNPGAMLTSRLQLVSSGSLDEGFRRLARGHSDYFISEYYPALAYLKRQGRTTEFQVAQPFLKITDYFIAWSKASPCIQRREEVDTALDAIIRSGELRRILERSIDRLRQSPVGVEGRPMSHGDRRLHPANLLAAGRP